MQGPQQRNKNSKLGFIEYNYKNIENDRVIPRHCKPNPLTDFFSDRFIFSLYYSWAGAAKTHGALNILFVLRGHFITLISYYELSINHFPV